MADDSSAQPIEVNREPGDQPQLKAGYDNYRSLTDPNLVIFVPNSTVPPFRLKAGGWELLKSSVGLNLDARIQIAEMGYLTVRVTGSDEPVLNDLGAQMGSSETVELISEARAPTPENGRSVEVVSPVSSDEQVPSVQLQQEPPPSLEVEFALVLSRMIDSVKSDPEHLRGTVYELARVKLKQQFGSETSADMQELTKALETAIHSVETFVQKNDFDAWALPRSGEAHPQRLLAASHIAANAEPMAKVINVSGGRRTFRFTAWRPGLGFAIGVAIVFAITAGVTIRSMKNQVGQVASSRIEGNSRPVPVAQPPEGKKGSSEREPVQPPPPLTPTTYGIYAVSEDKLYELELLPIRAPDIRIAISPAISAPSKTTLPNGHLKFIVYRRDSATNAADRAEVRIIAKIARGTNFNEAGKVLVSKLDDAWVIRNIAIPFRTAPKKDTPDMYEVQSEYPDQALTPGRYALVLKGQAYDFAVAGEATDPRQCLERLTATNGQFYSECQKP